MDDYDNDDYYYSPRDRAADQRASGLVETVTGLMWLIVAIIFIVVAPWLAAAVAAVWAGWRAITWIGSMGERAGERRAAEQQMRMAAELARWREDKQRADLQRLKEQAAAGKSWAQEILKYYE